MAIDGLVGLRHALLDSSLEFSLDFRAATTILANIKGSIITTGVGKSGHIARKVSASMLSLGIHSQPVHPTEASHGDLGALRAGDAVLAFSHSGESMEVAVVASHAAWLGAPMVLITSQGLSSLAKQAAVTIAYPPCDEGFARAPTTSTTQQIVIGDMLTVAIAECRGITPEDFAKNHPGGAIGRAGNGI